MALRPCMMYHAGHICPPLQARPMTHTLINSAPESSRTREAHRQRTLPCVCTADLCKFVLYLQKPCIGKAAQFDKHRGKPKISLLLLTCADPFFCYFSSTHEYVFFIKMVSCYKYHFGAFFLCSIN